MTNPYISVIISTTRIGGLDVIFSGLEGQIFKDFELILVDSLYEYRKNLVSEKSKKYSFRIKHLLPRGFGFSAATWCRDQNTALTNAEGHLAYFIGDYSWLHPECLAVHADFHRYEKQDKHCGLLCSFDLRNPPKIHKDFYRTYSGTVPYDTESNKILFVEQEKQHFSNYISDIVSGKLNNLMWSIFDEPLTDVMSLQQTETREALPIGLVENRRCFLRNESFVLDDILSINGFNEELDGSHGWQDWEFIDRASAMLGMKLYGKPNITATNVNPRALIYCRNRSRGVFANESVWKKGLAENFKTKVNDYSIKEVRDQNLGLSNE